MNNNNNNNNKINYIYFIYFINIVYNCIYPIKTLKIFFLRYYWKKFFNWNSDITLGNLKLKDVT